MRPQGNHLSVTPPDKGGFFMSADQVLAHQSRREVLRLGLHAIIAAGIGPAIVRASSLMTIRPLPAYPPNLYTLANFLRPSRSTGFCEALRKEWAMNKLQRRLPDCEAVSELRYGITKGWFLIDLNRRY
jgi:hypothetical protein